MKRSLLKFEDFLVWKFEMRTGEKKVLKPEETNRGLTDHGPFTLASICLFVSGKFVTLRDGHPPIEHYPGTGGDYALKADSWRGHAIMCVEDGEYHCITVRGAPKFLNRITSTVERDGSFICLPGPAWLYSSTGRLFVNTAQTLMPIDLEVGSKFVMIWDPKSECSTSDTDQNTTSGSSGPDSSACIPLSSLPFSG